MVKDKSWLKQEILDIFWRTEIDDNLNIQDANLIFDKVENAINQLDEPEKPVIPKFIANWIEETKKQGKSLVFAITHIYYKNEIGKSPNKEEKKIFQWMELAYNEEVFARAWIDGYEVEKEKLYHVRAGIRYVRFNLDGSIIGAKKDNSIVCLERLSKLPFDYKKAVESGIITLEEVTE